MGDKEVAKTRKGVFKMKKVVTKKMSAQLRQRHKALFEQLDTLLESYIRSTKPLPIPVLIREMNGEGS